MGREVKRVPLDFSWPERKVWRGYITPEKFSEKKCPDCKNGWSSHGQLLYDQWYGYAPFTPDEPLTVETPAVRAFAERNCARSPEYYGNSVNDIVREAMRLCMLWNRMWCHHITQEDVDALVAAGRLYDFTHTWVKGEGWKPKDPPYVPSAAEVNEWNITSMGHDSINAHVAVRAKCERDGQPDTCATCGGHSSLEAYPGQRAEAEAWEPEEPPSGEGWQLWETVTEGSPASPVFSSAEGLAMWMAGLGKDEFGNDDLSYAPYDTALAFVREGWAPSFIASDGGVQTGVQAAGSAAAGGGEDVQATAE